MSDGKPAWERKDTAALLGLILGALAIRLTFVLNMRPPVVSDAEWYYARAVGIVHGLGYTVHGYPTAFWPPGWPYFMAGVIWLFGPSVLAVEIVEAVLNALTVGVVFLIGRCVFGRVYGIAGGTAYAVLPSAVEWSAVLVSEPLYTFLWALATYIWVSRETRQFGWFAFSGLLLGAAALVRPSALLFWLILLAYLVTLKREREHPIRIAALVGITACCTFVVAAPAIVRDYHVYDKLIIISNNGGVSLYQANNPRATGGYTALYNSEIAKLISDPRTEAQGDELASRLAIEYIKSHPLHELWLAVRKVKALYSGDEGAIRLSFRADHYREMPSPPPTDHVAVAFLRLNTIVYYTLMLFALFGIALCLTKNRWRDEQNAGWRLLLGLILYNTAIFAVMGGLDRYRYPTMPYFAVFAGLGIVTVIAYTGDTSAARTQAQAKPRERTI